MILAFVDAVTAFVVIAKLATVFPPATKTDDGTEAELELLFRLTEMPAGGAKEPSVTVPVTREAPVTDVAPSIRPLNVGASTINVPDALLVPSLALIVAVALVPTGLVDTGKFAVVAPAETVTEVVTVAAEFEEESVTVEPPLPAFFERVTVPVALAPPTTAVGDKLTFVTV